MQSKKVCSEQVNDPYPRMCGKPAAYKVQCYENFFYVCEEHQHLYKICAPVEKEFSSTGTDFTPKQRWQVMERDGFKCVRCGRTVEDGIKLHVDHIFPKSKGGMATLENGRTLCNECNIGKGARIEKPHPTQHALDAATAARLPSSFSAEVINPAMGQGATRRAQ